MTIVNQLAKRNFVVRSESETDGRKRTLQLLLGGATALQDAKRTIHTHEQWLRRRFSAKELKALIALLRKIHG